MEINSKNKVHIPLTYNPIVIARELGYPSCVVDAIINAQTEEEITKIMIDARHGSFKKYEKVQKIQSV